MRSMHSTTNHHMHGLSPLALTAFHKSTTREIMAVCEQSAGGYDYYNFPSVYSLSKIQEAVRLDPSIGYT